MNILTTDELMSRIQQEIKDRSKKNEVKEKTDLVIEEIPGGFRIDGLVCTGVPKSEATGILLSAKGLNYEESAKKLNKSVNAVCSSLKKFRVRILRSNIDGDPDGLSATAITKAFLFAYMYYENMSIFILPQEQWELMAIALGKQNFNQSEIEVARLVFIDGLKISEAAEKTGIDFDSADSAIRDIEFRLGQAEEMLYHGKISIEDVKKKALKSGLIT